MGQEAPPANSSAVACPPPEPALFGRPAAVDDERGPGHHQGSIGGEKHDRAHQVFHVADATELDLAEHETAKLGILEKGLRHWRFDESRRERIHPDIMWREFERHRLRHAFERVLAGAIDAAAGLPTWPICDEIWMIDPGRPVAISRRATACDMKNAARTLMSRMRSKSVLVTSTNGAGRFVPALLTRMSKGSLPAMNVSTSSSLVTSRTRPSARPPLSRIAAAAAAIS